MALVGHRCFATAVKSSSTVATTSSAAAVGTWLDVCRIAVSVGPTDSTGA